VGAGAFGYWWVKVGVVEVAGLCGGRKVQVSVMLGVVVRGGLWVQVQVRAVAKWCLQVGDILCADVCDGW
jgi:hypothetical protein